jgi:hypothetical protein
MGSKGVLVAVLVLLVVLLIAGYYWHRRRSCPTCEGFYWTEWNGGNERENLTSRREGYDQRRRRSRSRFEGRTPSVFESFGAYGKTDPFGGFPDVNPHPERHCGDTGRDDRFISGAAPCVLRRCRLDAEASGDAAPKSHGRAETKMIRSASIYEGFSPDAPGSCPTKSSRAAEVEAEALRAAAGY